ncbi:AmmeMemoRadiSam system radical SAM enzyme [Candidatus Woesearchaeota archaeon]|nr:AmmeMemoRadiSam system radical SAM enzyme [Candidatus Woesearchaeota archaeon]
MREASFWEPMSDGKVRCTLCPKRCVIPPGKKGYCGVRENREGALYALTYGKPCSMAVDPVEKKPLYHFLPSSKAFSIATAGCNIRCEWCQNWEISHPKEGFIIAPYGDIPPEEIIAACKDAGCPVIAFTYTEPTVFYEYMLDIAKLAHKKGIRTAMVSNGYIEERPLRALLPYLDAANIDLKSFSDYSYRRWTGARLAPVLGTIERLKEAGVHLELTTLIVPGVNDTEEELEMLYSWVEDSLGADQVVHVSKFFPCYKAEDKPPTPMASLERALRIARDHLQYVYLGNVGGERDTRCPACGEVVVARKADGAEVRVKDGMCACGQRIKGVWE